jgi:hypothetical protein
MIFLDLATTKNKLLKDNEWLRKDVLPVEINIDHKGAAESITGYIGVNEHIPTIDSHFLSFSCYKYTVERQALLDKVRVTDAYYSHLEEYTENGFCNLWVLFVAET